MTTEMTPALADSFGRPITHLRISLTDQCNFRCQYCMPSEGIDFLPQAAHLNNEAILCFVRVACRLGVSRVRLTGGEPLLRRDLLPLVEGLAAIPNLTDIALTTNGSRLESLAKPLKQAGLHRINVSLDSLNPKRFHAITRSRSFSQVMAGIEAALAVGFPLKLNVVVLNGMNDGEILSLVDFSLSHAIAVRFLEFMPLCGSAWKPEWVYPIGEVRRLIERHYHLTAESRGNEAAQTFWAESGTRKGRVGFVGSLSEPFCDTCTRMRLTVDGKIRPCLFSKQEFDVKSLLDAGASDGDLMEAIAAAIWQKPRGSKYATETAPYLQAYDGKERENPFIHSIGG